MSSSLLEVDTVWSNNIYELNETLTVSAGVNFTIQGTIAQPTLVRFASFDVQIRIQSNVKLTIRDAVFTGGGGIEDVNEDPLVVRIERLTCMEMQACFRRLWIGASDVQIAHSVFKDNQLGFENYGEPLLVTDTLFLRNNQAIQGGNVAIRNCIFSNNQGAVSGSDHTVSTSIFMYNGQAVQDPNTGNQYMSDVVFYRNQLGIFGNCCGNDLGGFSNVTFLWNSIAFWAPTTLADQAQVTGANFINSTVYHIEHNAAGSMDLPDIYWGTNDLNEIQDKIYDMIDNPAFGPVVTEPISDRPHIHSILVPGLEGDDNLNNWSPPLSFRGVRLEDEQTTLPPVVVPSPPTVVPSPATTSVPQLAISSSPSKVSAAPTEDPMDGPMQPSTAPFETGATPNPTLIIGSLDPTFPGDEEENQYRAVVSQLQQCLDLLEISVANEEHSAKTGTAIALYISLSINFAQLVLLIFAVLLLFKRVPFRPRSRPHSVSRSRPSSLSRSRPRSLSRSRPRSLSRPRSFLAIGASPGDNGPRKAELDSPKLGSSGREPMERHSSGRSNQRGLSHRDVGEWDSLGSKGVEETWLDEQNVDISSVQTATV